MPEFSNLLRQRLGAQQIKEDSAAPVHPDADTLTAFSEQLLPAAERQQVVTHLAGCAGCRDIVALSRPELAIPKAQPVFTPAAVPLWRRLFKPAFAFSGAVAVMAVAAVLVLQHPHPTSTGQQSNHEARVMPAPASAAPEQQNSASQPIAGNPSDAVQPQAPQSFAVNHPGLPVTRGRADIATSRIASRPAQSLDSMSPAKTSSAGIAAKPSSSPQVQPVLTAGLQKQDYLNNAFFQSSPDAVTLKQNGLPSASAARMSTENKLAANVGPIASAYDIPSNTSKSDLRLLTPPPPEHPSMFDKIKTAQHSIFHARLAVPPIKSNTLGFSAMSTKPGNEMQKEQQAEIAVAPAITDPGTQQHALASRALSPSTFASADISAPLWKIAAGKLFRSTGSEWEEAYPGASFQFTAVTPHGNEVWAGGSQATLIHSRDAGAHWETAKLGDAASGAIVSIVFLSSNVQVRTSDNQSWSSADGGKTWTQSSN
jgi:Photosynthesis system II assembly factor YCF48